MEAVVENFNDCFCPYRMKLPSFCSLLTNSAFTRFFSLKKFSYNVLNITHIFYIFYYRQSSLRLLFLNIFYIIVIYYFYLCMSISDKYLGFLHVSREYGIYFRENATNYLNECIVFDIKLGDKICSVVVLYRSPSQSSDKFESFLKNLELTLDRVMKNTPYMTVLLGDFNAKCSNWYKHEKRNFEGIAIEHISSQCGLYQVINEPTHILENSSSCIDLIFTSQPNLNTESGVHPSLHPNCHHQVIYAKFNLKVYYPPLYEREVWHYKEADTDLIRRSIEMFNWDRAFKNSNVNDMVDICTKTIYSILSNFIPHQTITIDDKDLPWFNTKIKSVLQEKNKIYKNFRKDRNNTQLLRKLGHLQNRLNNSTDSSKHNYYLRMANKLNSIQKISKAYWSLLKSFINKKKSNYPTNSTQ